ncbi:MAG: LEA type 2 family protein [Promethearchaeota archaeon]
MKKKIVIVVVVVLVAIIVPLAVILPMINAAKQLKFEAESLESASVSAFPTPTATLKLKINVQNPTGVSLPPVSGKYTLYVEGVNIGDGEFSEFTATANSNTSMTLTQDITGSAAVALVPKLLGGQTTYQVKIHITQLTIWGVFNIPLDIEQTQDVQLV